MTPRQQGPGREWCPRRSVPDLTWARGESGSGTTYYLLADEAGPLAQFIPPGLLAAFERPALAGTPAWAPMRFMGQAALTFASPGRVAGSEDAVFVAFGAAAWEALAGRDVPALADGPLQLTFARLPDAFP